MACTSGFKRHRLICRLRCEPVGLERLLQVVRRRGFGIERVNAEHDAGQLCVDLTVSGARSIETLRGHLVKLHTVQSVQRPMDRYLAAGPVDASMPAARRPCDRQSSR